MYSRVLREGTWFWSQGTGNGLAVPVPRGIGRPEVPAKFRQAKFRQEDDPDTGQRG